MTQRKEEKLKEDSLCAKSLKTWWLKISDVRWYLFQTDHPLSLTSRPGYRGQQSLLRFDFNPQNNILFLQTFAVFAIQFPSCWCLLSITIWRCKVFYKSLCTRYLPHSLCFLSEKIHWFSTDWNRHWETFGQICFWYIGQHNEIFW